MTGDSKPIPHRRHPRGYRLIKQFWAGETEENARANAAALAGVKAAEVRLDPGHWDDYPEDGREAGMRDEGWSAFVKVKKR